MLNMAYGQYYNAAIVKPAVTSRCTQGSVGFKGAAGAGQALKGHLRGAFSGGEIQRLRRLRQEAHTPTVLVAVSD